MSMVYSKGPANRSAEGGAQEARQLLDAIGHGYLKPGAVYDSMRRAGQVDGRLIPDTPGLRAWAECMQYKLREALKR